MAEIQYWLNVQRERAKLPVDKQAFHITSIDNGILRDYKEGVVCLANRAITAERLASRTHRLATPEEIVAYEAQQEVNTRTLQEIELKRQLGQSPGILAAQIASIAASQATGDAGRKGKGA